MICRQCGAQYDGAVCPVCGAKNEETLWNPAKSMAEVTGDTHTESGASPALPTENPAGGTAPAEDYFAPEAFPVDTVGGEDDPLLPDPITPVPPAPAAPEPAKKPSKQAKKRETRREKERKTLAGGSGKHQLPARRELIFPAIGFLLPLAYLFFDLFAALGAAPGGAGLSGFLNLATSPAYNANTAGELLDAAFGTESPLTLLSLGNLSLSSFRAPLLTVVICVILSALTGVLLLCVGTRLLRARLLSDFAVLTGFLGAFAPLAGKLAYLLSACRGGSAALERASAELTPSLEAWLLMLVCCAFLLPAVATLKRLSARAHGKTPYTPLLCESAGRNFALAKTFAAVFLALCLCVGALFFVGRVYLPDYRLSAWRAGDLLTKTGELLRTAISGAGEGNPALAVLSLIADLFFLIALPVLAIALVVLAVRLGMILFTRKTLSSKKSRKKRVNEGRVTAAVGRRTLLLPFWFGMAYRVLAGAMLLSFMGVHLDFNAPGEALTMIYLALFGAASMFSVSGAYALLAGIGFVFWHLAGGFHNAMSARRVPADRKGEV